MKKSFPSFVTAMLLFAFSAPVFCSEFVYELLAVGEFDGLSELAVNDKYEFVNETLYMIAEEVDRTGGAFVVTGTGDEVITPFPPTDTDGDLFIADDVSSMLEVTFTDDVSYLRSAGLEHLIALPWTIVAYTDDDLVNVIVGVPETFVRLYFRGAKNIDGLVDHAGEVHLRLSQIVENALSPIEEFETGLAYGIPGTEMPEALIAMIETETGPITGDFIAPRISIPGVPVEEVVATLEDAFLAPTVPDLNQDGVVDQADHELLPSMFVAYMTGQISFDEMAEMLGQGFQLWSYGLTFQQWAIPRTLDLSRPGLGKMYIIELCQPFYAATALSTGLHHAPSMPCAVAVWVEKGSVEVSLLNPEFIFAYFFADAVPYMPPTMAQLFAVFPTMVFNELAGVVNSAASVLGAEETIPLHDFPGM